MAIGQRTKAIYTEYWRPVSARFVLSETKVPRLRVALEDVPFWAFHGAYPEEQRLGGQFRVSVWMEVDAAAYAAEDLNTTPDYAGVYAWLAQEMAQPRQLLETLARQLAQGLRQRHPHLKNVCVRVTKLDPPVGGLCPTVWAEWEE